jgi:hypothetical protein
VETVKWRDSAACSGYPKRRTMITGTLAGFVVGAVTLSGVIAAAFLPAWFGWAAMFVLGVLAGWRATDVWGNKWWLAIAAMAAGTLVLSTLVVYVFFVVHWTIETHRWAWPAEARP